MALNREGTEKNTTNGTPPQASNETLVAMRLEDWVELYEA